MKQCVSCLQLQKEEPCSALHRQVPLVPHAVDGLHLHRTFVCDVTDKSFAHVFCPQVLALVLLAAVAHSRPTNEAGWQEDPTQSQLPAQPVITQTKQAP